MTRLYFILLFLALAAYGQQQERVAIINTVDDRDSIGTSDLTYLTDRLRGVAVKVLPKQRYGVMTTESIVAFLGSQERAQKECREASCLADLGRKVNADYVAQARIGRFNKNLTIKTELYSSKSGNLIGSFTGDSKSLQGLLGIINEEAPSLFKELLDVVSTAPTPSPTPTPIPPISTSATTPTNYLEDSRDGKKYRTVVIGKQTWMAENLNYNANGSKCYDNKPANCDKYGRLYNWETAMKACPKGWHLPSDKDWNVLMKFVNPKCSDNSDCKNAGTKLKATSGWNDDKDEESGEVRSGNGEDKYGFRALPGGCGSSSGNFDIVGNNGLWWSASENNSNYASDRRMNHYNEDVNYNSVGKSVLCSVRCLKD